MKPQFVDGREVTGKPYPIPETQRHTVRAFSLFEVLAVIVVVAILLAAFLQPDRGSKPHNSRGITCLSNQKQLVLGWIMYTQDNSDKLMASHGGTSAAWCDGTMNRWPDCTDTKPIINGRLFSYVKNIALFHCLADKSTVDPASHTINPFGGKGVPRIRSVSMNSWLNGPTNQISTPDQTVFKKITDIRNPTETMVLMEENPALIDDSMFVTTIPSAKWHDLPATNHGNGTYMSFADGHSPYHKWHDPAILGNSPQRDIAPQDGGIDLKWLQHIATTYAAIEPPPPQPSSDAQTNNLPK